MAVRVTSIAADFYARLGDMRAYPRKSGAETVKAFDEPLPEEGLQGTAGSAPAAAAVERQVVR